MNGLFDHIRSMIEKDGPISISRYMDLALQHPEYGYYRKDDPLGSGGDFVTAPEISQMFGELIGLCFAEAWKAMGKPDAFALCELGPGRGTLMSDALRATSKIHGFHEAMDLLLIESNQTLRAQQEKKLAGHHPIYFDDFGAAFEFLASSPRRRESIFAADDKKMDARLRGHDAGKGMPAFIVANEFFDALSIRQFENTSEGWRERLVTANGGKLEFVLSPPDPAFLFLIPQDLREAPAGTVHEVSLPGLACARHIAQHIAKHGGAALIIDYGYAAPPGKGTLQAVSGHHYADVLERPGEVDLTAHVDFMALKKIALGEGWPSSSPLAGEDPQGQSLDCEVSGQPRPSHPTNPFGHRTFGRFDPREGEGIPAVHAVPLVLGPTTQGEFLQALGIEMRALQLKHNATPEQEKAIDDAVHRLTDPAEMGALFKVMAIVSPQLGELAGF